MGRQRVPNRWSGKRKAAISKFGFANWDVMEIIRRKAKRFGVLMPRNKFVKIRRRLRE